jgi:hypothetical protein
LCCATTLANGSNLEKDAVYNLIKRKLIYDLNIVMEQVAITLSEATLIVFPALPESTITLRTKYHRNAKNSVK